MKLTLFSTVLLVLTLAACQPAKQSKGDFTFYGGDFETAKAISVAQFFDATASDSMAHTKTYVLQGSIDAVCQMSGCWIDIFDKEPKSDILYVDLHDSGIKLPKDIAGADVVISGKFDFVSEEIEDETTGEKQEIQSLRFKADHVAVKNAAK